MGKNKPQAGQDQEVDKHIKTKYASDDRYRDNSKECQQAGVTPECPHCAVKYRGEIIAEYVQWLDKDSTLNATSRRNGEYICRTCGKTEAMADYLGLSDEMARTVVDQDREEALRLPPGIFWGSSKWPTGGWKEHYAEYERRWNARLEFRQEHVDNDPGG